MADDIRRLSDELARDPRSLAFLPLAEALRRQGQLHHALKIVMRGLERHPHLADAHDLLARIHADQGETQKAFDEWDMVLRLAPGHAGAAKGMGFICFREGRPEEAERYLRLALDGDPDDDRIHSALALVQRRRASRSEPTPDPHGAARSAGAAAAIRADVLSADEERPRPPAAGMPDARMLFTGVLPGDDQTALLLDRDGLVLAGAYFTDEGRDVAQEVGAELSGVSDEAARATRHLGIGTWRAIVFEAEAATVAMAPAAGDGLVVLAAGGAAPLGLTRRLLDRCADAAHRWLGAGR